MADLYIDAQALDRLRQALGTMAEVLGRPGRELAQLDTACLGSPRLRERTSEFADEWSYGIGLLARFGGAAAEELTRIESTFRAVDDALARAFVPEGP